MRLVRLPLWLRLPSMTCLLQTSRVRQLPRMAHLWLLTGLHFIGEEDIPRDFVELFHDSAAKL